MPSNIHSSRIARALATAIACGTACSAFAQDSVMVYGTLDVALNYINNNGGASRKSLDGNTAGKSRLGVRGSEDLGDGLRALFQLESNFAPDTGALSDPGGRFWNRAALVGLSHRNWGSLTLGRQNDFIYIDVPKTSAPLLIGGQAGGWQAVTGVGGTPLQLDTHYGGVAYDNTIKWKGEAYGVKYGLMYGLGTENSKDKMASAFASWQHGPLWVGIGWVKDNFSTAVVAREVTALSVNYSAGGYVLFANTTRARDTSTGAHIQPTEDGLTCDLTPLWMVGANLAYVPLVDNQGKRAHLTQPAVGTKYYLSKRTLVFASLARNQTSDKSIVAATLDRPGGATAPSTSNFQTGFRMGVQTSF